mgnify:CR=1 FL=1
MISSVESFYAAATPATARLDAWIAAATPPARADHLCFKCADPAEYERMRAFFENESRFIYQSIIAGRRIALVGLSRPLATKLGDIRFLELSDQKPDGSQTSGFDHIELFPTSGTLEALVEAFAATGISFEKTVRPHHTTYDLAIGDGFKVRLEAEPLVDKIKNEEMR